ncbi:hypothetical protein [Gemella cuniculi]|uniref:hypothetical protein n=1 Tax=Gemella cuniculi TaxID=150240 RepID=UPI000417B392|nr:hypothetical protein [Gemella cuniculi]
MYIHYIELNHEELLNISGGCDGFWSCLGYGIQRWAISTGKSNAEEARRDNGFGWP